MNLRTTLVLSTLLLALSACASQPAAPPPADPATEPTAPDTVVTIGLKFMPPDITVQVGDTVSWENGETIGHTVTSGPWGELNAETGLRGTATADGMFDHNLSPMGEDGDSFEFTFTEAGTFLYYCKPHLTMNATVTVEP